MKNKSTLAFLVLTLCIVILSTVGVSAAETVEEGTCGDNLTWSLDSKGTLTISGTGEIIWISGISEDNKALVKNLVIENGATGIGEGVFANFVNLTTVEIPDSVTYIGGWDGTFYGCENITAVKISSLESWLNIKFENEGRLPSSNPLCYGANLYLNDVLVEELVIPESVTEIKEFTFFGCESITSVVIHNGVTVIGYGAFLNCENLKYLTTGYGLNPNFCDGFYPYEYESEFKRVQLEKLTFTGNEQEWKNKCGVIYPFHDCEIEFLNEYHIVQTGQCGENVVWELDSDGVMTVSGQGDMPGNSFRGVDEHYPMEFYVDVKSVIIEPGITSVADFRGFWSLESVTLPEGVTNIGGYAETLISEIIIPDGATTIGPNAFYNCDNLTSIIIPDSVKYIGDSAFECCRNLTDVKMPKSLDYLGKLAFSYCRIQNIVIPAGITKIPVCAFEECRAKSIKIPYGVEELGWHAISWCSEKIMIPPTVTKVNLSDNYFNGYDDPTTIIQCVEGSFAHKLAIDLKEEGINIDYELIDIREFYNKEYNITGVTFRSLSGKEYPYITRGEENYAVLSLDSIGISDGKDKVVIVGYTAKDNDVRKPVFISWADVLEDNTAEVKIPALTELSIVLEVYMCSGESLMPLLNCKYVDEFAVKRPSSGGGAGSGESFVGKL